MTRHNKKNIRDVKTALLMFIFSSMMGLGCNGPKASRPQKDTAKKSNTATADKTSGPPPGQMATQLAAAARYFKNQDPPPVGINLVLIVVDTLRADRLGAYGYSKNTSPNIDTIARQGTLFHRFYAASPWTAPSFGTLFTGMTPSVHMGGMVLNETDEDVLKQSAKALNGFSLYPLRSDVKTLAEQLLCCVDTTAAFVSNPFLHPSLGFDRGFATYSYTVKTRPAKIITDEALAWIRQNAERQFMTVIHYMDTHQPYNPDESYRAEFFPMDGGRLKKSVMQTFGELQRMKLTPNELAFLKGLYDAQIRYVDRQIGRVMETLASLQLLENSWVVITADHGEEHFDHGSFFHGLQYTDEVVRVPLIVRAPGGRWGAGNQVAYSACQQDLVPTILEWFNSSIPENVEGSSLVPMLTGAEKSDRRCYMEMSMLRDAKNSDIEKRYRRHAFFDGRYKAIQTLDAAHTMVYDLDYDALEQYPLPRSHPGAYRALRALIQYAENRKARLFDIPLPEQPTTLPDDVSESLKNLGYMR